MYSLESSLTFLSSSKSFKSQGNVGVCQILGVNCSAVFHRIATDIIAYILPSRYNFEGVPWFRGAHLTQLRHSRSILLVHYYVNRRHGTANYVNWSVAMSPP